MRRLVAASGLVLGVVGIAAVGLGGCATRGVDLVSTGRVVVGGDAATGVERAPEVEGVGGDLIVRGRLSEAEASGGDHVRVRVIGPDGVMLHEATARRGAVRAARSTMRGPRGAGRRVETGPAYAAYSVRIAGLPPAGSRVEVWLMDGAGDPP